jgi:hypothetical protein
MPIACYRIKNPTMAMFDDDGRHVSWTVPVGALITVEGATPDGGGRTSSARLARKIRANCLLTTDLTAWY